MSYRVISRVCSEDLSFGTDRFICSLCRERFKDGFQSKINKPNPKDYTIPYDPVVLICQYCISDLIDVHDDIVDNRRKRISRAKKGTIVVDTEGRLVTKRNS